MRKTAWILVFVLLVSLCVPSFAETEAVEISAPSAVLMEASSGEVLFEKNSHEKRSSASITKVMTLILVFEAIEGGALSLDDTLSASAHAASMGGSDIWLKEGETMTVDELIKATVIMSANDAAVVLAENVAGSEQAFVARMNEKAAELGMNDTLFKNCNGLDEEGHLTSAYDVALMSRELIKYPKVFDYTLTWMDYLRNGETQLVNTNKLIKTYNGITGLKTGTTSQAGSCITATAERNSMHLISVILGAADTKQRFSDAAALLDYGFAGYSIIVPEIPPVGKLRVEKSMEEEIEVRADPAPKILMKAAEKKDTQSEIIFNEEITAPVSTGQQVGVIRYSAGGEMVAEVPIRAAQDAHEITFSSMFMLLLSYLFTV